MKRTNLNKYLVAAGGLTLLSGLFLLFHYESHFAKASHQIAGFILVCFSIFHMKLNWKALRNSFAGNKSLWVVVFIFIVSVSVMVATGEFAAGDGIIIKSDLNTFATNVN